MPTNKERIARLAFELDRCLATIRGSITGLELELLQMAERFEQHKADAHATHHADVTRILALETRLEALETQALTVIYPGTELDG